MNGLQTGVSNPPVLITQASSVRCEQVNAAIHASAAGRGGGCLRGLFWALVLECAGAVVVGSCLLALHIIRI